VKEYKNIWNSEQHRDNVIRNDMKNMNKIWATELKGIIKLSKKEKQLVSNTQIVYARPPTIGNMVTNYKSFSEIDNNTCEERKKLEGSKKCGKCGLCGKYGGLKNMVRECKEIIRKDGERIKIRQNVNCKDCGIYAARCRLCEQLYVGQTINRFSQRWNGHRAEWRKMVGRDGEANGTVEEHDKQALFLHYLKNHKDKIWKENGGKLELADAFEVIFLEKSEKNKLDTAENFWISKLKADININKTFLPKFK
jgi:hypothetical protein